MEATLTQLRNVSVCLRTYGIDEYLLRNDRNNEWILEPSVLEVLSAVVEDEIDTSQLLKTLEKTAGQKALADGTLEAVEVSGLREAHFITVIGFDFTQLFH